MVHSTLQSCDVAVLDEVNEVMSRWKAAVSCGSAILALAAGALAQDPPPVGQTPPPAAAAPPPQPASGQTPFYDPQQLPAQRGRVQQFTLTPRGDIDGLILSDGTEVKTPPHLSTEIAYSVKPGDTVTVHGLRAAVLPLVQAVSITDEQTGRTVVDTGPPGPGRRPAAPPPPPPWPGAPPAGPAAPIPGLPAAQGRVPITLHGPQAHLTRPCPHA